MTGIGYGHNSMSNNIFLSHFASLPAATKAINSDSMVEWEIHVCLFDAQEMAPPTKSEYPTRHGFVITHTSNPTNIRITFQHNWKFGIKESQTYGFL